MNIKLKTPSLSAVLLVAAAFTMPPGSAFAKCTLFPRLAERRHQLAGSMSGGEQQMCAMARGLMTAPILLMIGEMSWELAPVAVEQLMDALTTIRGEGVTISLVEQDVNPALSIADRGYVMETGHIIRSGLARELVDDPEVRHAYPRL